MRTSYEWGSEYRCGLLYYLRVSYYLELRGTRRLTLVPLRRLKISIVSPQFPDLAAPYRASTTSFDLVCRKCIEETPLGVAGH